MPLEVVCYFPFCFVGVKQNGEKLNWSFLIIVLKLSLLNLSRHVHALILYTCIYQ